MTSDHVKQVFAICREFNVRSIKYQDLEATFELQEAQTTLSSLPGAGKMPSEEDFLFAAVEGFNPEPKEQPNLIPTAPKETEEG